ncbi:MAG: hypothetical protein ACYS9X_08910 [Planctomycetota bacterium]|jgi:hypothetical protein
MKFHPSPVIVLWILVMGGFGTVFVLGGLGTFCSAEYGDLLLYLRAALALLMGIPMVGLAGYCLLKAPAALSRPMFQISDEGIGEMDDGPPGESTFIPWSSIRSLRYERPQRWLNRCLCIEVATPYAGSLSRIPHWPNQRQEAHLFILPGPARSRPPVAPGNILLGISFHGWDQGIREALSYIRSHPPPGVLLLNIAQPPDGSDEATASEGDASETE